MQEFNKILKKLIEIRKRWRCAMAKGELFSGESKNIEYKVAVPDKSEKYMKTVVLLPIRKAEGWL